MLIPSCAGKKRENASIVAHYNVGYEKMRLLKIKTNRDGFTLAEVMVSTFITLLVLGALLTSFVMGRFAASLAKHKSQAINLLQARMEEEKALGYDALQAKRLQEPEQDGVVLDGNVDSRDNLVCTLMTNIIDVDPSDDILEIRTRASWSEPTIGYDVFIMEEMGTLVSRAGGS